jgi:hypothetical protein
MRIHGQNYWGFWLSPSSDILGITGIPDDEKSRKNLVILSVIYHGQSPLESTYSLWLLYYLFKFSTIHPLFRSHPYNSQLMNGTVCGLLENFCRKNVLQIPSALCELDVRLLQHSGSPCLTHEREKVGSSVYSFVRGSTILCRGQLRFALGSNSN